MICRECGRQIGDDVLFCTFCGKPTENNMSNSKSEKVESDVQKSAVETKSNNPQRRIADMFVSPDEEELAVLGSGYLSSFIKTGSLSKGYGVLTKKRFYYKGKCYYRIGNQYKTSEEERIVNLLSISGTGFTVIKSVYLIVIIIILMVFALICCIAALATNELGVFALAIIPSVIAAILFGIYDVTQKRVFEITYNGGSLAFKTDYFSNMEIREFQKALHLAKDDFDSVKDDMEN